MSLLTPFLEYGFMQKALWTAMLLSLSAAPIGAFVVLRRLSLVGDTLSHGLLPGAALAFALFGFSLFAMGVGAVLAGLAVALFSGLVAQKTALKEDASFASFYLISVALGTVLISVKGTSGDLLHFLYGNLLAVPDQVLYGVAACSAITITLFVMLYRYFLAEAFDPAFMRLNKLGGNAYYFLFLFLFVLNVVGAFFAMGTLLSLGLFILPAVTAKLWARSIPALIGIAVILGWAASFAGLLLSYYWNIPAGPCIVLCLGGFYILSIFRYMLGSKSCAFYPSSR